MVYAKTDYIANELFIRIKIKLSHYKRILIMLYLRIKAKDNVENIFFCYVKSNISVFNDFFGKTKTTITWHLKQAMYKRHHWILANPRAKSCLCKHVNLNLQEEPNLQLRSREFYLYDFRIRNYWNLIFWA